MYEITSHILYLIFDPNYQLVHIQFQVGRGIIVGMALGIRDSHNVRNFQTPHLDLLFFPHHPASRHPHTKFNYSSPLSILVLDTTLALVVDE